jgi:RNA polymerase sigma-70 factor (ECF subfamily)
MVDVDLVRAAQSGEALALSRLLDELGPFVGRICGAVALEDGADASQETLIAVMRDLKTLRQPEALRGWVRRIATREAVRHAERSRRRAGTPVSHREVPAPGDPELARDVRAVLEGLSPDQRAILVLRDLEGLSESEAAAELSVAPGTVKSRLHRARSVFRRIWVGEGGKP